MSLPTPWRRQSMKLTVFNGSPRGTGSNTKLILEHFLDGFSQSPGNEYEVFYLNHTKKHAELVDKFLKSEAVLFAFPLYTDCMPGLVKAFFELLAPLKGKKENPPIAFIVQYGFSEGIHGQYLKRYLEKLAKKLNSSLMGIAHRGGVEGIQMMPPMMTKKLFRLFYELGKGFGSTGQFDAGLVKTIARKERFSLSSKITAKVMQMLRVSNLYWDRMLKSNNTYEKRYDRPSVK